MRQGRRWRGLVFALGVAIYAWGVAGAAAAPHDGTSYGPDWSLIAKGLLGLMMAVGAAYARGLDSRVKKLEAAVAATQRSLDRDYHSKQELAAQFAMINASVNAVHRRLDYLRLPSVFPLHQDDGA